MRILGFGTYDLATHPRVGIIFEGLVAHGHRVVEVNEPLGFGTAERVAMISSRWRPVRLITRLLRRWVVLARRTLRPDGSRSFDAVIVGYLAHFDVIFARILFPRTRIVLDLLIFGGDTLRDRGIADARKLRLANALDRIAIRCADVIVVDTPENAELISPASRIRSVVVPVGAGPEWFASGNHGLRASARELRVVFFGLYTPLQGATVIGQALALLADRRDIAVTMIGSGQEAAETRRRAQANLSVSWRDWVGAAELPEVVAEHDVCLGIFGTTQKAYRVVPNKVYQGAAAGCAIVTSETTPQRRALGDAALYVPPGNSRELADALAMLAEDRGRVEDLATEARRVAEARFGPESVVQSLLHALADPK